MTENLAPFALQRFSSTFEVFFFDFLRILLFTNPGSLGNKPLTLGEVIKAGAVAPLVSEAINEKLHKIRYEKPKDWFEFAESVMKLGCPSDDEIEKVAEIKATRDVFEHNSGVAGKIYLGKAGSKARFKEGDSIDVPDPYLGTLSEEETTELLELQHRAEKQLEYLDSQLLDDVALMEKSAENLDVTLHDAVRLAFSVVTKGKDDEQEDRPRGKGRRITSCAEADLARRISTVSIIAIHTFRPGTRLAGPPTPRHSVELKSLPRVRPSSRCLVKSRSGCSTTSLLTAPNCPASWAKARLGDLPLSKVMKLPMFGTLPTTLSRLQPYSSELTNSRSIK